MKTFVIALFALVSISAQAKTAPAQKNPVYTVDSVHSSVQFRVRHLVSRVTGRFDKFTGKIEFDEKKPTAAKFEGSIEANSVNTDNAKRDAHLKSEDFFHGEKFPAITFVSEKVTGNAKKGKIMGQFTMRGITKPLTLNYEFHGVSKGMDDENHIGMSFTGKVNRKDFGISWNKSIEGVKELMIGDEVDLMIEVEAGTNTAR